MNKKFLRCIASIMAFMMLFASVALANNEDTYEGDDKYVGAYLNEDGDIILKYQQQDNGNQWNGMKIEKSDCYLMDDELDEPVYDENGNEIKIYCYKFYVEKTSVYHFQGNDNIGKASGYYYKQGQNEKVIYSSNEMQLQLYSGGTISIGTGNILDKYGNQLFGSESNTGNGYDVGATFDLTENEPYFMYFTEEQLDQEGGVRLSYKDVANNSGTVATDFGHFYSEQLEEEDEEDSFRKIEKILADFVLIIGKSINWTLSAALGRTLTMDDIVFNRYEEIRLDYFTYGVDGGVVQNKSNMVEALKAPINKCYSVFTQIAIFGYIIILVYVGLRMLLDSTSADKKATGKAAFLYWCTGIIILFMYPYVMKYIILIDDALVSDIGSYAPSVKTTNLVNDGDGVLANMEEKINYADLSKDAPQDYMSLLGYRAQTAKSLGISIAYLIITWQLVMMVVYYYKRTFMVGFLIMVFPFVALTYIIDKLNDGKSQALSGWTREFVFCVMIQIFHAAVYVFVVNTIYATIDSGDIDTILVMIAATFMFEGENIMKQIFGGNKTLAVGSPAQNAVKMAALAGFGLKTAKSAVKGATTGAKVVGRVGLGLGRGARHGFQVARDTIVDGKGHRFGTFKDSFKNNTDLYKNWRLMHGGFGEVADRNMKNARMAQILPSSGNITENINETAEAIDLINNGKTVKDMAEGLDKLRELMKRKGSMTEQERKQFDAMMKVCNISADQFINIQNGVNMAAIMAGRKADPKTINQHLKMTVEYTFSNLKDDEKKKMVSKVYAATMYNMRAGYVDKEFIEDAVKKDWNEKRETAYRFGKNAKFRSVRGTTVDSAGLSNDMQKAARGYKRQLTSKINGYDNLPDAEKKKIVAVTTAVSYFNMTEGNQLESLKKHMSSLNQDFGANQQVIKDFISSNIDMDEIQKRIQTMEHVETRMEGIRKQFTAKYGDKLPDNMTKEQFNDLIEGVAKLEQINSGEFSVVEAGKAIQAVDNGGEIAKKLLKISNLDMDIDSIKYLLAQAMTENSNGVRPGASDQAKADYNQVMGWARNTVDTMVNNGVSPTEKDPVTSIYDIINAAKSNGGVSNFEELYVNSTPGAAIDTKVNGVVDSTKKFASTILKEIIDADKDNKSVTEQDKAYARIADSADEKVGRVRQAFKNAWERTSDEYNTKTVNGYTYEEWMDMKNAESKERVNDVIKGAGEIFAKPAMEFFGGVIAMALTDDGMPIGEAVTGMAAGAKVIDTAMDNISTESKVNAKKKKIKDNVEKRLKKAEKDMLIARGESSEDNINELRLNLISGNRYENADGDFHVTLKIIAENATYMSIGESNYIGPWVTYVEDYDYELKNPKAPNLYVRLRDSSGNIINSNVPLN